MLSYQHHYHAGNAADVHKHAVLAWVLEYLTRKPKPLSYIETHAGRGLYDLGAPEALRTGEAAAGIGRLESRLPPGHPYRRALDAVRRARGADAYPGSPALAAELLRPGDPMHLAELHPAEGAALAEAMAHRARIHAADGIATAFALCPPVPRRGLLLIDPSWEIKSDYAAMPGTLRKLHRAWNVGVLMLWYPLLRDARHASMLAALEALDLPGALRLEARFSQVREGHNMTGSGLFVVNAPWGLAEQARDLARLLQ